MLDKGNEKGVCVGDVCNSNALSNHVGQPAQAFQEDALGLLLATPVQLPLGLSHAHEHVLVLDGDV